MTSDEPEDDEPTEPDDEQQPEDNGEEPEETAESASVNATLRYVSGNTNVVGQDMWQTVNNIVINVRKEDANRLLRELERDRKPKRPPPPPDAPKIDQVRHWFEELPDDRRRCYALTLAIFNGVKFSDYTSLREKIAAGLGVRPGKDEPPPSPFARATGEEIDGKVEMIRDGDQPDLIIRFKDEEYVAALFELLRRPDGYPDVALRLLRLLRDIGIEFHAWEIRVRAAEAAADLGQLTFHYLRREVLDVWAGDERTYVRATAGYPLRRLAEGDVCRDQTLALLGEWSRPGRDLPGPEWRYRWAAASAYKQIGNIDQPWASPAAINGLRELAGNGHIAVVNAVIHSLLVHSLSGRTQMNNVLLALKQWIEEGSRGDRRNPAPQNRCLTGILALMLIADVHLALAANVRDGNITDVPSANLFDLVREGEINRGDFWQLMIAAGVRSFEFQKIPGFFWLIERWSEYIADDAALSGTIVRLIVDVYQALQPDKYRPRLFTRLERWERQTKNRDLSACATRAREKILRGEWTTTTGGRIVFGG